MSFPFGRPILAIMICSLLAGAAIVFRPAVEKTDLSLWVSVESHARLYRHMAGGSCRVDLIAPAALDVRLLSMFMFGQNSASSPDLVEVDLGSVGKFFRPPVQDVGLLPLNGYLQKSGWMDRIVKSRFTPWSKQGVIFGVPDDLHPCTITYRKDLFDQAGVNLEKAATWDDLQRCCVEFQQYWHARGHSRVAMGFSSTSPDMLLVMLHQQRLQLVDEDLTVHLTDEKAIRTLSWYAEAVAGDRAFATDLNPAPGQNARDLASGEICALITPDWMVADLKQFGPECSGHLQMIPLPRFHRDDATTASWGGTMMGITRTCPRPDAAWKMLEHLYLDHASLELRNQTTGIIPPIPDYWSDPAFHQPDPFFADQKVDELYIRLARDLPGNVMTPYTTAAQTYLTIALNQAISHVRSNGNADLETYCRLCLGDAQQRVESMIRFDGRRTNQ